MRRFTGKMLLCIVLSLSMLCSFVGAFAETVPYGAASGENDVKTAEDQINYYSRSGKVEKWFNFEQFMDTQIAKDSISALYNYFNYPAEDQDNDAITSYWAAKGVTKEYFDLGDPERQWAIYYPNGTYFEADEDYEYPVVFCYHGGNNTILMTESYGWCELAGKEGFIAVLPWAQTWNREDITIEETARILDVLREKFSIDESRIYATGFSAGGRSTVNVVMAYPETFAACAVTTTALYPIEDEAVYRSENYAFKSVFAEEDFEKITELKMPMMLFGGTMDGNWPINNDPEQDWPVTSEDLNTWLNITGANFPEVTDETRKEIAEHSGIGVERMTGFDFDLDKIEIVEKQGTYCYIGSYLNDDGVCTLRCLAVEGMVHWPLYCEAELCWEFMSQFARDTETGALLY